MVDEDSHSAKVGVEQGEAIYHSLSREPAAKGEPGKEAPGNVDGVSMSPL